MRHTTTLKSQQSAYIGSVRGDGVTADGQLFCSEERHPVTDVLETPDANTGSGRHPVTGESYRDVLIAIGKEGRVTGTYKRRLTQHLHKVDSP